MAATATATATATDGGWRRSGVTIDHLLYGTKGCHRGHTLIEAVCITLEVKDEH
jgi:hypothetical protein